MINACTERKAKEKICPQLKDGEYRCFGARCMWWKWATTNKSHSNRGILSMQKSRGFRYEE